MNCSKLLERLHKKIKREMERFKKTVAKWDIETLWDNVGKINSYFDILQVFEDCSDDDFSEDILVFLLSKDNPLDYIYTNMDFDNSSYNDKIVVSINSLCVEVFVDAQPN